MTARELAKKYLLPIPILGGVLLFLFRLQFALRYVLDPIKKMVGWLVTSREVDNFTYHLTELNRAHLAAFVAIVSHKPIKDIEGYCEEIQTDQKLHDQLVLNQRRDRSRWSDDEPRYGRRIGWYALVRALKPKVVVETGVDKGLGACVISAALLKNRAEGTPGRYYGTDINREAGYLLAGDYASVATIIYGDSIKSLEQFDQPIDLFINDSDHSTSYEAREYLLIQSKLTPEAIVIGDNAHTSDELIKFARASGRQFLFFKEEPVDHWYPGGGIGVAYL